MKNNTTYVAFSTQKGGAGKTTLTVITASYLHYVKGYNVAVVDCDYPQHSIIELRDRDLNMVLTDEHYKLMAYEQFTVLGKKAYPVIESTPEGAIEAATQLEETGDFDIIFFDLPGTVNNTDVIRTLSSMDYIFSPISADRVVLESTLRFARVLSQQLMAAGRSSIKGMYLLWNLVDGREKTDLYEVYEEVIKKLGLKMLKTFLPDSKRFRREQSATHRALLRSTLFPADKSLVKGANIDQLIDEVLEIIM